MPGTCGDAVSVPVDVEGDTMAVGQGLWREFMGGGSRAQVPTVTCLVRDPRCGISCLEVCLGSY